MNIGMIDTLSFSVDIEGYPQIAQKILSNLEELKDRAKFLEADKISDKTIITIGSMSFEVMPNGANGYAYILHNQEYEIKFAMFRSKNKDFYPIKIRIKSDCLWSLKPYKAYKNIISWVNSNIGEPSADKISRIDLCCHTDSLNLKTDSIETFKGLFRKTNVRTDNRKASGFEFGSRSGMVYCRIYDKCKEIHDKNQKFWFYKIWTDKGMNTENVWNVEFELKRDFLREYNLDSVIDAFKSLQTIWEHCTSKWLVNVLLERTRIENCPISKEWIEIQNSFDEFGDFPLIRREEQMIADADALIPATIGIITTISARLGTYNMYECFKTVQEKSSEYLDKKDKSFREVVEDKMLLLKENKGGETIV